MIINDKLKQTLKAFPGLPVNEIFASIQGEGLYTGYPCIFIRLQGCPVQCSWCDTKGAINLHETRVEDDIEYLFSSTDQLRNRFCIIPPVKIVHLIKQRFPRHDRVVITGGEPAIHDIYELIKILKQKYRIHIETTGHFPFAGSHDCHWITVSPKLHFSNELVLPVSEWKFVISGPDDFIQITEYLREKRVFYNQANCWLQPNCFQPEATELCIKKVMEEPDKWKLSVQMHKIINVR